MYDVLRCTQRGVKDMGVVKYRTSVNARGIVLGRILKERLNFDILGPRGFRSTDLAKLFEQRGYFEGTGHQPSKQHIAALFTVPTPGSKRYGKKPIELPECFGTWFIEKFHIDPNSKIWRDFGYASIMHKLPPDWED